NNWVRTPASSCRQPRIQFIKQLRQPIPEKLMGLRESANLIERNLFKVVHLNGYRPGDVVLDGIQPAALFRSELGASGGLLREPLLVAFLDRFAERCEQGSGV